MKRKHLSELALLTMSRAVVSVLPLAFAASVQAARLIPNGDFEAKVQFQNLEFDDTLDISALDAGWQGSSNSGRTFNAMSTLSGNYKAPRGEANAFIYAHDGGDNQSNWPDNSPGATWNLFSMGKPVKGLNLDVIVRTAAAGSSKRGPTGVHYIVFGFNGNRSELERALRVAKIGVNSGTELLNPSIASAGFQGIASGTLGPVTNTDSWETQAAAKFDEVTYDFLLVGFSTSNPNAGRGVGIDNVGVVLSEDDPVGIPEPSMIALVAAVFGATLFVRRFRR